jgi:hypothetical protein
MKFRYKQYYKYIHYFYYEKVHVYAYSRATITPIRAIPKKQCWMRPISVLERECALIATQFFFLPSVRGISDCVWFSGDTEMDIIIAKKKNDDDAVIVM